MTERQDIRISRARRYELSEDIGRNRSTAPTLGDVINRRVGRRDVMRGALAVTAMTAAGTAGLAGSRYAYAQSASFDFEELEAGVDDTHHVAAGYDADILIRWGDPVVPGAPAFDVNAQSADAQAMQFGYNNDYLGYFPLPAGSETADHGVLVVNHEYTNSELMFAELGETLTEEQVRIELAAHGLSVIEVRRNGDGKWSYDPESSLNRRITLSTEMTISGPAAGHARLQTSADPTGTRVLGTVNNCAGGYTPWGTVLTAEENFHGYFGGELPAEDANAASFERYGAPGGWYDWSLYESRFDVGQEPNEPNRFGWIVEFDPYNPEATPIKRTALGRFKHEGAMPIVNPDGRVIFYTGDDERFDYLYKYVSNGTFDPAAGADNGALLDDGVLYVARFNDDGSVDWLPLVHGEGPLTEENGFASQADVLIDTRLAADALGATPMDRPEEVEPNQVTGRVYVMLTNNTRREEADPANPRGPNPYGHIVEITAPDGDHTATTAGWEILVRCGDPANPEHEAQWNPATTENGWFGSPDNCAVDHAGRLWITTDGNAYDYSGRTDGVWAMETEGDLRGTSRHFFRVPVGAEMCGPEFTPDDETLFVAVQHPADGGEEWPDFGRESTFADPSTRWPDFEDGMPPRPSVLAITRQGGGRIG